MSSERSLKRLVLAALFLSLALILPFFTGQVPQIGNMLCPMHLPVLLCGFICGPLYGAVTGLAAPLLRFLLFGMPPLMPTGIAMSLELCAYGLVSGLLCRRFPVKPVYVYASLIPAMLCGRLVWGAAQTVLLGLTGSAFTWKAFLAGAVLNAVPGMLLQLVLVPALVPALSKHVQS